MMHGTMCLLKKMQIFSLVVLIIAKMHVLRSGFYLVFSFAHK